MSKITESARGQNCTVRIPEVCTYDTETTVFAHLPGGGMGKKKSDLQGAYACHACHDAVDGRSKTIFGKNALELWHRRGVERTQEMLLKNELITITGD